MLDRLHSNELFYSLYLRRTRKSATMWPSIWCRWAVSSSAVHELKESFLEIRGKSSKLLSHQTHTLVSELRFFGYSSRHAFYKTEDVRRDLTTFWRQCCWLAVLVISRVHLNGFPVSTGLMCCPWVFKNSPLVRVGICSVTTCQSTSVMYCTIPVPLITFAWRWCAHQSSLA